MEDPSKFVAVPVAPVPSAIDRAVSNFDTVSCLGEYISVAVPLIVIVPTLFPLVVLAENDTASAFSVIPSSFSLSVGLISPGAVLVAVAFGIVTVLSVAQVTCPVESDVICDTVNVPPNPGVALAAGFPVLAVYVG